MGQNRRNKNHAINTTLQGRKPSTPPSNVQQKNLKDLSLDEAKLTVEIEKLELEKIKIALEQDKLLVVLGGNNPTP